MLRCWKCTVKSSVFFICKDNIFYCPVLKYMLCSATSWNCNHLVCPQPAASQAGKRARHSAILPFPDWLAPNPCRRNLSQRRKSLPSGRALIPFLKMPDSPLMFCSRLQITMRSSPWSMKISAVEFYRCIIWIRKMRQLPIFNYLTILPGRLLLHIARDIISASRRGHWSSLREIISTLVTLCMQC